MAFKKQYEIIKSAPKQVEWEEYHRKITEEYELLLENNGDKEDVFQRFFEENPSYLPGALELFGQSGHYPYMDALISQPEIGSVFKRKPDFVWLANDSLTFVPVFIETQYFSGNAHLPKYNICGWLICGEWKLADVVVKEEGDNPFIHICKQFSTKKGGCIWKLHTIGKVLK